MLNAILVSALLALSSFGGALSSHVAPSFDADDWSLAGGGNAGAYFTFTEEAIVASSAQTEMRGNFLIYDAETFQGDYTVTMKGQGTSNWPVTKFLHIGIIPWYVDSSNYVLSYMEWASNERPSGMRVVELTGRINGENPVVYKDGEFKQSEWNDIWMDNDNAVYAVEPSSEWTFSVEKARSEAGDTDEFYCYINGNQVGFYGFRDTTAYEATPAKVGIYIYNEDVTITEFTVTTEDYVYQYHDIGNGAVGRSTGGDWTYDGANFTVDNSSASLSDIAANTALIENIYNGGNYKIDITFDASILGSTAGIGIVAWYQSEYNYLIGYVSKAGSSTIINYLGLITYQDGATLTQTVISESTTATDVPTSGDITLTAAKAGSEIALYIGSEENGLSQRSVNFATSPLLGVAMAGTGGTIAFAIEENPYRAYDWRTTVIDGESVSVKASTDDDTLFSISEGTYTVSEDAVTVGDTSEHAAMYFATSYVGELEATATFAALQSNQEYGLYAFMADEDNYVRVGLSLSGINVYISLNGTETATTYSLPSGFSRMSTHTIATEMSLGLVDIYIDGTAVATGYDATGISLNNALSVGFFFAGHGGSLSSFVYSGFVPGSTVESDGWYLTGPRPDTWTFGEDGSLYGSLTGGTTWMETNALIANEDTYDFWSGVTIEATEVTASEHKVGLVPYYVDSDNYIFVWFSRWSGATPYINATVKLNGSVVGTEWNEVAIGIDYESTPNKLEVHIEGNTLSVYVSGNYSATYTGTFEGLSTRNMEGAKVGFNISNVSATFSDFDLVSDERVYISDEKPVITEVGTRVTSGIIGEQVRLPVYTATNSNGDYLTATLTVTAPDGTDIDVSTYRFTPDQLGDYEVLVTCTDEWGNEADPINYNITITDGTESTDGGGGGDGEGLGIGAIVGIVVGSVAGVVIIAAAIYFILKALKKKSVK